MIHCHVRNRDGRVRKLKDSVATILDRTATCDYGQFVHIQDPDGKKIELWGPLDSFITQIGGRTTKY